LPKIDIFIIFLCFWFPFPLKEIWNLKKNLFNAKFSKFRFKTTKFQILWNELKEFWTFWSTSLCKFDHFYQSFGSFTVQWKIFIKNFFLKNWEKFPKKNFKKKDKNTEITKKFMTYCFSEIIRQIPIWKCYKFKWICFQFKIAIRKSMRTMNSSI